MEPAAAATAAVTKASSMGVSGFSRPESAAERRLALLPLISAVMGVTVALNKSEWVTVVVIFIVRQYVETGTGVACVVAVLCDI